MSLPVSLVVNTFNRAEPLSKLLDSLKQLDYRDLEVVVVNGPSTDRTGDVIRRWSGAVKAVDCFDRNLSRSRNLGIAQASGDLVAFMDDDAYPDPAWLRRLVPVFDDQEVAAAGGPVFDQTGFDLQALYNLANPMGDVRTLGSGVNPTEYVNFPETAEFLYTIGTNSVFRRDRLVEIGGFDEEFEYYLDEVDVCYRLVRRGYLVAAVDDAFVYHKFLASDVRSPNRAIKNRLPVIKNKLYFALKHGLRQKSFFDLMNGILVYVEASRADYQWCVQNGLLTPEDLEQFERDLHPAFDLALAAHKRGTERTRPAEWFDEAESMFVRFPTLDPEGGRLHLCFLSQEYPPGPVNGIARVIHTLATGLAAQGHIVRVLTKGAVRTLVDLEDGVWVHRVAVKEHAAPATPQAPGHIWSYSASMLEELIRIDSLWPVDLVEGPNWDSELVAILVDGRFETVLGLYTPLVMARQINPRLFGEDPMLDRMVELEAICCRQASALRVSGLSVVEAVEALHGLQIPRERVGVIPHGLPDLTVPPESDESGSISVLFVGRLEKRKGIDTLLACVPGLVEEFPHLVVTVAGNDTIPGEDGMPYRARFEQGIGRELPPGTVEFTGLVEDDELRRLYARCHLLVAPSRFESFGLILVEAMMHGKPVIAGDNPGMRMIVEEGENGYIVPAEDAVALRGAIASLVSSPDRRKAFGIRSRQIYEERFSSDRMVADSVRFYRGLVAGRQPEAARSSGSDG